MSVAELEYSEMNKNFAPIQRIMDLLVNEESSVDKIKEEIARYLSQNDVKYYGQTVLYAVKISTVIRPRLYDKYTTLYNELITQYGISDENDYHSRNILYILKRVFDPSKDPLYLLIINDDIEEVKKIICSKLEFDFQSHSYMYYITHYGAVKCFKYFLCNGMNIYHQYLADVIEGGNEEMIYIMVNNLDVPVTNFELKVSISYHRYCITDWLILNWFEDYLGVENDMLESYNFRFMEIYFRKYKHLPFDIMRYNKWMSIIDTHNFPLIQFKIESPSYHPYWVVHDFFTISCLWDYKTLKQFFTTEYAQYFGVPRPEEDKDHPYEKFFK